MRPGHCSFPKGQRTVVFRVGRSSEPTHCYSWTTWRSIGERSNHWWRNSTMSKSCRYTCSPEALECPPLDASRSCSATGCRNGDGGCSRDPRRRPPAPHSGGDGDRGRAPLGADQAAFSADRGLRAQSRRSLRPPDAGGRSSHVRPGGGIVNLRMRAIVLSALPIDHRAAARASGDHPATASER